jgi:hypothetical protein
MQILIHHPLMEKGCITCDVLQNPPSLGHVTSGSRGGKSQPRTNNDHWKRKEVKKLVDGIERYGLAWTKVKKYYFPGQKGEKCAGSLPVRDPTNLKVCIIARSEQFSGCL